MCRDLKLEEGTSKRIAINGTRTKSLSNGIKKFASGVESFFIPRSSSLRKSTFLLWCMYSMFMDPLFLYTPVMKDDKKCFELDINLGYQAIVVRSVVDFNFLINSVFEMVQEFKEMFGVSPLLFFMFDLSIVLPLPQVLVILASIQRMRGSKFLVAMKFFNQQHALKIIRFYTLVRKAKTSSKLTGWAKFTFNLSYFHAAHIIGACYYFFALKRKTACWRKACTNHIGCEQLPFHCDNKLGNYTFSNDFCSSNTQNNITTYNFGIFIDAIQFGVVEETKFFKRYFASFRWSLQILSSFGQGLPLSTNILENVFVMCITITGVVLFFFLIAKVQSEMSKSEEIRHKIKEIHGWLPFAKLTKKLQNEVKKHQSSFKWKETYRGVDVESLLNNLPEDLRNNIQRELCQDLLKNVVQFRKWSEPQLKELCDVVKPALFTERSYIVREGDTIDQMLFVLQGKLWSYTTVRNLPNAVLSMNNNNVDDCCGEELVAWAKDDHRDSSSSSNYQLPISTRTIKAVTNVEAFVVTADDLKKVVMIFKQNNAARVVQLFWRARRIVQGTTPQSPSSRIFWAFRVGAATTR